MEQNQVVSENSQNVESLQAVSSEHLAIVSRYANVVKKHNDSRHLSYNLVEWTKKNFPEYRYLEDNHLELLIVEYLYRDLA